MTQTTRYVLAGVGNRGLTFFAEPLRKEFKDYGDLVGLFDISHARMAAVNHIWGTALPVYTDFSVMLRELVPDVVIITTNDASHADYVIKTLMAGKRVICEKPLVINADQARRVLQAIQHTERQNIGQSLVAHNMRYDPGVNRVKELVEDGAIGQLLRIHFQENLDRHHGADYFRRWHRFKANSGGLLVQKSSHDFDFLNWLVKSPPLQVIARGSLAVYGKCGPFRGLRCKGCAHSEKCSYFAELATWAENNSGLQLYALAENESGYIRDGCVFDERIDIEDQVDVLYKFENGVEVTYCLTAYSSIESWRVELEGTAGKITYEEICPTDWPPGNYVVPGLEKFHSRRLMLYSYRNGMLEIPTTGWMNDWEAELTTMLPDLFSHSKTAPLTDRQASLEDGIWAVMVGIAANYSIENGSQPIDIKSLLE
jgi:predicted dehydrogenase